MEKVKITFGMEIHTAVIINMVRVSKYSSFFITLKLGKPDGKGIYRWANQSYY